MLATTSPRLYNCSHRTREVLALAKPGEVIKQELRSQLAYQERVYARSPDILRGTSLYDNLPPDKLGVTFFIPKRSVGRAVMHRFVEPEQLEGLFQ